MNNALSLNVTTMLCTIVNLFNYAFITIDDYPTLNSLLYTIVNIPYMQLIISVTVLPIELDPYNLSPHSTPIVYSLINVATYVRR